MKLDYIQVKAIPFARVLGHYGVVLSEKAITGEQKLQGYCPICHPEKSPNPRKNQFQVTVGSEKYPRTNNTFHCFACESRGTVIDFVTLMEKLVDWQSVDWQEVGKRRQAGDNSYNWCPVEKLKLASALLHSWFIEPEKGSKIVQEPSKDNGDSPGMAQVPEASETAKKEKIPENRPWVEVWGREPTYSKFYAENEYLASRGIRPEVLQEFGVGYYFNPKSKSRLNGHILFPIHNQLGQLVAFGWRTTSDEGQRYCFPPAEMELKSGQKVRFNKSMLLWNLHRALKDDACGVIVVEGFFSAMNLWQNGYRSVVALMGSSLGEAQAEILVNEFAIATFVLDPDEAGQKVKKQAIAMLLPKMPIKVVEPSKQVDLMSKEEMQELLS